MKTINSLCSKLLALTLALVASVSTFAYEFEYVNDFHVDGFAYKVLPPTMEAPFGNVALIEIADCTEDVVIPGTVTHEGVTYIVTTLGGGATLFTNFAKEIVKSVFIPKKISTINSPLFADCSNLTSIVVDSRNSYYDSRENCNAIITTSQNSFFTPNMLIVGCKTTTIPNSVTEIADKAFYRSAIESITIPTGVTKIGHSAFNQATLLSSIKLPITLTEIGDWAFADCLSLNTISCYALEPPTISSNTFFGSNPIYNNPSIYVPAYCIEAYKNAEHWKWFTQILPINEPAYKDRWCDTWNVLTIKREFETWQYNLAYDTIIGDYTYTAVTRHTTKVPAGVYPVMAPEPEYVAAVRFTEDKKAFIYYDNTEYLLYDFNAQPGDELTVFAGINHYRSHKTNRCGIGEVNIFPDSNYYYSREISLNVYPNYTGSIVPTCFGITKWIEGVGDICGLITGADCGLSDDQSALLCAYKDGNTEYTTEYEEYAEYGCEYNSGENKEYILTLPGLQRTEVEFHTDGASAPSLVSFNEYTPTLVNGKWYLYDGRNYLREENNQVLLYSPEFEIYEDVVLYDWTLEIGDTLPFTIRPFDDDKMRGAVFRVTDVSTITLLDGKEYKKWTLACGIEYIEGIGAINGEGFGNYFCIQHTAHPATYIDTRLVCASRNGKLLYQMDDAEMERLGAECLCDVETSYKSQWCNQWNILEYNVSGMGIPEETWRYYLAEDITINGTTYTTVNRYWTADKTKCESVATIRFTENQKVYALLGDTEYLVYDFSVQVGDTIETIVGVNYGTMLQQLLVHQIDIAMPTGPKTITLYPICKMEDGECDDCDEDGHYLWECCPIEWIEGIGSTDGFLMGYPPCGHVGGIGHKLLCAYKDDELQYINELYQDDYGCEYNAGQNPEDLFPTLWGLQRTGCTKTIGENGNGTTVWGSRSYLMQEIETATIDGKQYLLFGTNNIYDEYCSLWLREENNKILLYSTAQKKDLVLYDFTLNVGDSLPRLYVDYDLSSVVDYDNDEWGLAPLVVTEVSTITLLDGKEYKKWTFDNGMQYVEGIGSFGTCYAHNDFYQLIANAPRYSDVYSQHLVCVSKNNKLLYQMDAAEMEQLETECLCEIEQKWSETWCNQWNILSHGYQGPQDPLAAARTSIFWLSNNTLNRDGQEYIPLMCSSSKPDVESTNLIGELRFTEDKQVYFYYDNTEYLLYDFGAQVGDTLDIFGGIELYSYSFVEQKTYPHVITKIDTLDDGRLQITSDAIVVFEDSYGAFEEKMPQTWIEGLGSTNGIVYTSINPGIAGDAAIVMLCAYRDYECVYKTDSNDPYWIDYTQLGCVYNEGDFIEDAFPILSGLQRTVCNEYCGDTEDDNSANNTYKQTFDSIFFENDKPYILCNDYLLREEDNKILIYSQSLNKDLVLYDFTLEVGDSLSALYVNAPQLVPPQSDDITMVPPPYNGYIEYYNSYGTTESFFVTEVSSVTLLDGNVYKKWTFDNGMEYVEGIGMYGGRRNGNFFGLIQEVVVPCHIGTHLVCVSRNGQLLYQMDAAAMERLGAECLCDYNSGPKKDNAKNGKIGGRPTPTQWNMLEVETKEMDGTPTILRAETFSYTLENDSIVAKGKTFYQLARQSTKDTAITKSFVGALHFGEDEDNRVYFLRDGVEYVLYDFTAEPGDTIEIFAGINNYPQYTTYTHVVTGKDTLENGACRMMLEVVFPDETTIATNAEKVWLAGLGSIDGIVHNAAQRTSDAHAAPAKSASSETQTSVMLCAWREDSCLYTTNHPEYDTFGCVYNQDPTAVEDISTTSSYQKILHEGKLLILHNGKIYNVLGVSVK